MYHEYPYSNFHELNADWLINTVKKIEEKNDQISSSIQTIIEKEITKLKDSGYFDNIVNIDKINAIESKLENITNPDMICIGDSYGAQENSWADKLLAKMTKTKNKYNFSKAGAGFGKGSVDGNTPEKILNDNIAKVTHPENVGVILVGMGANDIVYPDGVEDGMNKFKILVGKLLPNAKVLVAPIGNIFGKASGSFNVTTKNFNKMLLNYSQGARVNGFFLVENAWNIMKNEAYFMADNVHPSQIGGTVIADCLYTYINNGSFSTSSFLHTSTVVIGGASTEYFEPLDIDATSQKGNLSIEIADSIATITLNRCNIKIKNHTEKVKWENLKINLGRVYNPTCKGDLPQHLVSEPFNFRVLTSSGYKVTSGMVAIEGGSLIAYIDEPSITESINNLVFYNYPVIVCSSMIN